MSKSLMQTVNTSSQTVAVNGIISPGTVTRRFGCNIRLDGNAQQLNGEGYYARTGAVTVQPTAAGIVSVALYEDGVQIPGAISSETAAAGDTITLPLEATTRLSCCKTNAQITCVLISGAGTVTNYTMRVEKV